MHPTLSVIFFTVISGSGYGLLFLLGVVLTIVPQRISGGEAIVTLTLGGGFASAGLLSSMLHLGQPGRAWRAFSQWRSSWLSREGVAAILSFAPMLAIVWLEWQSPAAAMLRVSGLLLAVCAALVVVCTAKIYSTLKTIPAWHNGFVLPGYLLLGLLGGTGWAWVVHAAYAPQIVVLPSVVAVLALASAFFKYAYWQHVDAMPFAGTAETATGLGRFGSVRSVEAPHTEQNYLTREMGFVLARKHARRLRWICLILIGVAPVMLAALTFLIPMFGTPYAAALSVTCGLFVERWLFFAQAKHVVMSYYGAQAHAQSA